MNDSMRGMPVVTFPQPSLERLLASENCGLCQGDLTDEPPGLEENCHFEYRGVSASVCTKSHLFHPLCVVKNIEKKSRFSCDDCKVVANVAPSELKTVRQLAGYPDENPGLHELQAMLRNILHKVSPHATKMNDGQGIIEQAEPARAFDLFTAQVPDCNFEKLRILSVDMDKQWENKNSEFQKLRGEVHYLMSLHYQSKKLQNDTDTEQALQSLFIACKSGITEARALLLKGYIEKMKYAPSDELQDSLLAKLKSLPDFERKQEFIQQAGSQLFLVHGEYYLEQYKKKDSDFNSIGTAIIKLRNAMILGNKKALPLSAECYYLKAECFCESDSVDVVMRVKLLPYLKIANSFGTEELKTKTAELARKLICYFQKKAEIAMKNVKDAFQKNCQRSPDELDSLKSLLNFAKAYGTDLIKEEAVKWLDNDVLLAVNRNLSEKPEIYGRLPNGRLLNTCSFQGVLMDDIILLGVADYLAIVVSFDDDELTKKVYKFFPSDVLQRASEICLKDCIATFSQEPMYQLDDLTLAHFWKRLSFVMSFGTANSQKQAEDCLKIKDTYLSLNKSRQLKPELSMESFEATDALFKAALYEL